MSVKEEILDNIRRNTQNRYEKPQPMTDGLTYTDKVDQFCRITKTVGGEFYILKEGEDLNKVVTQYYPGAMRIASVLPEVTCATVNPDSLETAQELDGTDVAIVEGRFGVAENGAVWIPQTVKHKALYFIAEKLVILLDKEYIVNTMHEAYRNLEGARYDFGTFISGPSKTADIEQALVMGAHGAKDVLVLLK